MKEVLPRPRLEAILNACQPLKVGVIGDFTLDAYWYADMTRAQLSRETPLYARPVVRETYSPGGAANVAWNLADLGVAKVFAFTALGVDWRADLFRQVLTQAGISLEHIVYDAQWSTPLYGKVVLMNRGLAQEDPRIDFVNTAPLSGPASQKLRRNIEMAADDLDAFVVADYQAVGVLNAGFRQALNRLAERMPARCWVADAREQIGSYPAMVRKPNEIEAARLIFPERSLEALSEEELLKGGLSLQAQAEKPLYITRGERGCWLFDQGTVRHIPAVQILPPVDPVGAGDTFVAVLTACLAAGANPWEAGVIATLAAAVTVRKLDITGTASPQEILDQYDAL
jgi:rfaE bifunctional protein kinase chain/domain